MGSVAKNTQLRRIIALFVALFAILIIIKRYELVCRRRNSHKPVQTDMNEFIEKDMKMKYTECEDCGCALKLQSDDDSNTFWIEEV